MSESNDNDDDKIILKLGLCDTLFVSFMPASHSSQRQFNFLITLFTLFFCCFLGEGISSEKSDAFNDDVSLINFPH